MVRLPSCPVAVFLGLLAGCSGATAVEDGATSVGDAAGDGQARRDARVGAAPTGEAGYVGDDASAPPGVQDAEFGDVVGSGATRDASAFEAGPTGDASGGDAARACSVGGVPGRCISKSACLALAGYTSTPGYCPGAADIECCTELPSVADNPPIPAGYILMQQSQVTPSMTTWAVDILDDPAMYPMFSTTMKAFGTLDVLARVEWHPPDFQNSVVHRGVTLYVPT